MGITKTIRTSLVGLTSVMVLALGVAPLSVASADDLDTEAPVVSVVSPTSDSVVRKNSTVNLEAAASDNVGVTQVDFYVQSTTDPETCTPKVCPDYLVCTGTSTTCAWHAPNVKNGLYFVTVVAYDAAGNSTTSTSVYFRVR